MGFKDIAISLNRGDLRRKREGGTAGIRANMSLLWDCPGKKREEIEDETFRIL